MSCLLHFSPKFCNNVLLFVILKTWGTWIDWFIMLSVQNVLSTNCNLQKFVYYHWVRKCIGNWLIPLDPSILQRAWDYKKGIIVWAQVLKMQLDGKICICSKTHGGREGQWTVNYTYIQKL